MKIYSDYPGRRARQIVGDVVALGFIALTVWVAVLIHGAIMILAIFGHTIEDAGDGFRQTMADAGESLGGIPLVGAGIRAPFDAASGAGQLLADAGQAQQDAVSTAAFLVAVGFAIPPIALTLWIWLRRRIRFIRRATAVASLTKLADGTDILALRALVTADGKRLRAISARPVDDWRAGDERVVRALAQLSLAGAGVRLR